MSNLKKIDAAIRGIATRYTGAANKVQEIALQIMAHAEEHGDCSRARNLVVALPPRFRSDLQRWFRSFSPINVKVGKDKVTANFLKEDSPNFNTFDLDAAANTRWDNLPKEESERDLLTFDKSRERLVKYLDKLAKDAVDESKTVSADMQSILADVSRLRNALLDRASEEATPAMSAPVRNVA